VSCCGSVVYVDVPFFRKMAILSASHLACIEAVLIVCVLLIADVL